MALLTSLEYFGIRSVPGNSQDKHKIDFESPLTIISGPNGSGKTTLIEALKFITAGETPPGDRYAFVHNPRIARTSRVDAFIGLQFKTEKDLKVTVIRRFNAALAKTKSGMQFKSDEGTIHVQNQYGEKRSLSSKTADFQSEVLKLLGVPAAILSNVIFCHQEDSCWPLSEPKELKTRFDKIFQLQKFTKAIEQAKKIRKEQLSSLKLLESESGRHEVLLKNKGKALKDKNEAKTFLTESVNQLTKLEEQIARINEEIIKMESDLKAIQENSGKRDVYQAELRVLNDTYAYKISQNVEPFEGSLIELQELAEEAAQKVNKEGQNSFVQSLEQLKRQIEQKKREKEVCQQELNEVLRKKTNYDKGTQQLSALESEVFSRFPFIKEGSSIPDAIIERKALLDNAVEIHRTAQEELDQDFLVSQSNCSIVRAEIKSLEEQKKRVDAEKVSIERKLSLIGDGNREENNIKKEIDRLEQCSSKIPKANEERNKEIIQEKAKVKKELEKLRNEIISVSKIEEQTKEATRIKGEFETAKKNYESLTEKHSEDMLFVFGSLPEEKWNDVVHKKKQEVDAKLKQIGELVSKYDFEFSNEKAIFDEAVKDEVELRELSDNIIHFLEEEYRTSFNFSHSINDEQNKIAAEIKKTRKELAPLNATSDLYEGWSNEIEKNSCCPLCERKFTGKTGSQALVQKLHDLTISLPSEIERLTKMLSDLEIKESIISKEKDKLTDINKKLQVCIERKNKAQRNYEDRDTSLNAARSDLLKVQIISEKLANVMGDLSLLENFYATYTTLKSKYESLPKISAGNTSSESIQITIKVKEEYLQKLEDESDEIDQLVQRHKKIESQIFELRGQLINIAEKSGQISSLEEQLERLTGQVVSIEEEIKQKKRLLPGLEEELSNKSKHREEVLADFKQRETFGRNEILEIEMALRNIKTLRQNIDQEFVTDQQIEVLKRQEKRLDSEYNDLNDEKCAAENNSGKFAKLLEKKKYIDQQLELFVTNQRIAGLNQQLQELNIPEEKELARLNEECKLKKIKIGQYLQKKAKLEGRMDENKKTLKEARICLEKSELKNAELNFRNTLINKSVCEKITEDLESFVTVLDESILKFHKDKMAAINIILDDLWRKVYNGVDIETIKIKTEKNEGADKRASYDYNVVMVLEGGIEVGMRDRCSAGQKMLASLLIRIALADVFAKTCSIIALDEPTTNLDTVKIEQMASMLNTLINTRRSDDEHGNLQGKQFQMIVITHDQRLVEALKLGCRPEKTFRISKDVMTGKSKLDAFDYSGNKVLPYN